MLEHLANENLESPGRVLITPEDAKEAISNASVYALAGAAGLNLAAKTTFDDDIDGTFHPVKDFGGRVIQTAFPVDFQMKATTKWRHEDDVVVYDLSARAHVILTDRERTSDPPPVSRTPLIRSLRAGKVFDGKDETEFTPEFKREAVALLESSGRPQMQIAAELGIQPAMLRQGRSALMGGSPPRTAGLPGTAPADVIVVVDTLAGQSAAATPSATRRPVMLIHGNDCGPGNNAPLAPVEALDAACARHDACTPDEGLPSKNCNRHLQVEAEMLADDPRQSPEIRMVASIVASGAAMMPFDGKGSTDRHASANPGVR